MEWEIKKGINGKKKGKNRLKNIEMNWKQLQ